MLYTKQQLIDAYCASEGVEAGDLPGIIITTQSMLDDRVVRYAERIDRAQARLDDATTVAKDYMKVIALRYLAKEAALQSITDNDAVSM